MARALVLLTAVVIAGCGGTSATRPAATTTHAATTTAPAPAAAPATASVSIENFSFAPATLRVKAGAKVTWHNRDQTNHNVTFSASGAPKSDGNLDQGASVTRTFTRPGSYAYVCTFHPGMRATVVVSK